MNKLPLLLKKLNENGINGAYSDIMADINKLIQDIEKAEGDIQSKINSLVADKQYADIARFTSIPQQINECAQEIKSMLDGAPTTEVKKTPVSKPEAKTEKKREDPVPVKEPVPVQHQNIPQPVKPVEPVKEIIQPAKKEPFITLIEDLK